MTADKLAKAINDLLDEYGETADEVVKKATDRVAKDAVQELRTSSETPRLTGAYAKGWGQKLTRSGRHVYGRTVYNRKHYRLTHLLEYGHALPQGGRSKAYPHIEPVEQEAIKEFERLLKEELKA